MRKDRKWDDSSGHLSQVLKSAWLRAMTGILAKLFVVVADNRAVSGAAPRSGAMVVVPG